jgi:hypothetical protein
MTAPPPGWGTPLRKSRKRNKATIAAFVAIPVIFVLLFGVAALYSASQDDVDGSGTAANVPTNEWTRRSEDAFLRGFEKEDGSGVDAQCALDEAEIAFISPDDLADAHGTKSAEWQNLLDSIVSNC